MARPIPRRTFRVGAVADPFSELMREGARAGRVPLRPLAVQESQLGRDVAAMEVITADGILYIADSNNHRVRRVVLSK